MFKRQGRVSKGLRCGVSLAAIATATSLSSIAFAQDSSSEPVSTERIVVTGSYRGSLKKAIDIKRNSVTAVDAIVAEDIAKFPDLNLSEAIQRIPGVSITRDAGEGRQISVRGLGAQFTRIRVNGMEALATAGGTDAAGGTNRTRSFDFNVFAADLFSNIKVNKTAGAETEEGSLGATVDLTPAHPFDYDGLTMAASIQGDYNDLSEEATPRGTALISDTFANGELGALISVAYSERNLMEEGASTVRWQNDGSNPPGIGSFSTGAANSRFGSETTPYTITQINQAFHPRIPRYDIYLHEQQRLGATASLQWQPAEETLVTFDALYSKFDAQREEIFLEAPVFSTTGAANIQNVDVLQAEIRGNSLVYGVFDDVDIRSEHRFDDLTTEFQQYTLTGEHEFSDNFRVNGIAGWSQSDHDNPIQTTILFDRFDVDGYSYDYRGNDRLPLITYGNANVTSPAAWTLTQIRLRPQTAVNTYSTVQGGAEFDTFDWLTLKGGADWKKYEYETTERRRDPTRQPAGSLPASCVNPALPGAQIQQIANAEACLPLFTTAPTTPITSISELVSLKGTGLDIPGGNTNTWLIPDIDAAAALWHLYDEFVFPLSIGPALSNNQSVTEESTAGFIQADFEFEKIRGNIGVRYVETQETASGLTFQPGGPATSGVITKQTVEHDYDDVLPSLNIAVDARDDVVVRFGAAKVMSRPALGSLSPGATVSVSGSAFAVTAGNPLLLPYRADTYDLALEWYFAEESLFSVALFYKNVDTFAFTVREIRPFTGNPLGIPDSVATAACGAVPGCNPAALWQFNLPKNTDGGPVAGVEVSYQQPLTFLGDWFDNFGTILNFTYVQSEIDYVDSGGIVVATDDLTNLSRRAFNATLYYEDDLFSARLSAAYRSAYLTTIPGRNGHVSEATKGTLNLDFSSGVNVTEEFKVTFEALNLTDEVNDQYLSPDDRTSFYHHFGREFLVGARYTY